MFPCALRRLLLAYLATISFQATAQTNSSSPASVGPEGIKLGHSAHGSAFDSGPRQKPWHMEGLGKAPFPITTRNPEVQEWFNQGNAMLHSFFFYEAERAFRWCAKLEPDNAMAYWGLARATEDRRAKRGDRAADFLREAVKRKDSVSERERLYIEAWEPTLLPDPTRTRSPDAHREQIKKLETIALKYPDDVEARSLLALLGMGESRYGTELILREVLARQPEHPGAHHYRIHNWDYHEPEQALESCRIYTETVPGIGHAQHMPGHIYSIVGMWDEAAISMDAATRVEKRYMRESLTFPFNNWNYGHNRNYLCYIQEQLGLPTAALFGARQLIDAPLDPEENGEQPYSSHSTGIRSLVRTLLKYERWDDLLKPDDIPWRDIAGDKRERAYCEARAWFGKGDIGKAEKSLKAHADLKTEPSKEGDQDRAYAIQAEELRARLALARGETIIGLGLLAGAAEKEYELQREYADPPGYPEALYNALGEAYLTARSPALAVEAFEKALKLTRNDLFALSGLVRAYAAQAETARAEEAMGRLLFVAAHAEPGLPVLERAKSTGVKGVARDCSPRPQRRYATVALDSYGPARWESYDAPPLEVRDSSDKAVSLKDYQGRNVLLVFYLGTECAHCMKQLREISGKKHDWERLDTVVLAVSSKQPSSAADGLKGITPDTIQLLSDTDHVNARRFHSYDDFEDIELHSTTLIDKRGRVHWARFGGDPFSDLDFITKQLERLNQSSKLTTASATDGAGQP
jgi:peroxiredoxin